MKLKCRINEVDYDIVQGCTFTENFNETLDSAVICIDQIPEIIDLKPYTDVYIWNADEEFNGYVNRGDYLHFDATSVWEVLVNSTSYNFIVSRTNSTAPFTNEPYWRATLTEFGTTRWYGPFWDIWFDAFVNGGLDHIENSRYGLVSGTESSNTSWQQIQVAYAGGVGTHYGVLEVDDPVYNGHNIIRIVPAVGDGDPVECTYNVEEHYIEGIIGRFSIYGGNYPYAGRYIFQKTNYSRQITITITDSAVLYRLERLTFSYKYMGKWYKALGSGRLKEKISDTEVVIELKIGANTKDVNFSLGENVWIGELVAQNGALNIFNYIDEILIDDIYTMSADYSQLPSFFKHMLIDSFAKYRLQLNDSYNNKDALFKYEINLFSETKKLEKIILPNVSITQSLLIEEKRTCWDYLNKFVNLYSPKYKKVNNELTKTWSYVSKYYVNDATNPYLQNINRHIITNLKEIFENVICPEFSLTNPSLKDVLSQIMITKDLIPIVFNDVIYGLDIGAVNLLEFNRNGTNFDVENLSSDNYATDARREYSNALSQENSAHLVEYLGFRNPNGVFLTLDDLTLQTRFPIYKINSIKLCYYKKFTLKDRSTGDILVNNKAFMCKYDITPLVLQNVVRNTLSTNWETFVTGQSGGAEHNDPLVDIQGIDDKIKFVSQYKLCTVGYDIGSNKITGWGTRYEYLEFLWFKNNVSYIENIVNLLESISNLGTEIFYSYLQSLNNEEAESQNIEVDIVMGSGLDGIISFGGGTNSDNIANKIKSIVFEVDYDAMYNGATICSKDYIDEDDITTPDNCNAALTVLEMDGLLEKEKMNRMSNSIFKIPARYDNQNGGATFNKVQQLATYDELTDSIIYSREYQIYDNLILANYESTREYILKNYFTSVWAKYRTYSYMSYGESITRSENFRNLLILSKESLYFEKENLISADEDIKYSMLNFIIPTRISNINVVTNLMKINCGFFTVNNSMYLSDVNSFSNGNSLCFNITMFDNVSAGNYIESMSSDLSFKSAAGASLSVDKQIDMKTTQNWYKMPESESDAFIQNVGIYFCHIDNEEFYKDGIITRTDVENNAYKFLALPFLESNSISDYQSYIMGNNFEINKDNKEVIDATLQFDYIVRKEDKDNILISSWVGKLNDLIGVYKKFEENVQLTERYEMTSGLTIFVYQKGNDNYSTVSGQDDWASKYVVFKISDDALNNLLYYLSGNVGAEVYLSGGDILGTFSYNSGWQSVSTSTQVRYWGTNSKLFFTRIEYADNNEIRLRYDYSADSKSQSRTVAASGRVTTTTHNATNAPLTLSYVNGNTIDGVHYNYFIGEIPGSLFYGDSFTTPSIVRRFMYFATAYRGDPNVLLLNENNSIVKESKLNIQSSSIESTDETNMIIIISTKKLEPKLVYDSYKVDNNNYINLPEGMYVDTKGFNGVTVGNKITNVFQIQDNSILVLAQLYNNYPQDIKSIQYYYRDDNNWLHFVFGVNVSRNEEYEYDNFNIYLSCVSKRNMRVYNNMHRLSGYARNYLEQINNQEYGTEQYYVLGHLEAPIIEVPQHLTSNNFIIRINNPNPFSCDLYLNNDTFISNIPVGDSILIINPTRPLEENEIDATEQLEDEVDAYVSDNLQNNLLGYFYDNNGDYTNSDNAIVLHKRYVSPPVVEFNIDYDDFNAEEDDSYSITVTNNNKVNVVFHIIGTSAVDLTFNVPRNSTITLQSTTDLNNALDNYVNYREVSIRGYFAYNDVKSATIMILEAASLLSAPHIENNYIEDAENEFVDLTTSIDNDNDCAVIVHILGSSYARELAYEIPPYGTLILSTESGNTYYSEDFEISIRASLQSFYIGGLSDNYYCYFTDHDEELSSDAALILDVDPLKPQIYVRTLTVSDFDYDIINNNPFPVDVKVQKGNRFINLGVCSASQSFRISYGVNANLDNWFDSWQNETLTENVVVWLSSRYSGFDSEQIIMWEKSA